MIGRAIRVFLPGMLVLACLSFLTVQHGETAPRLPHGLKATDEPPPIRPTPRSSPVMPIIDLSNPAVDPRRVSGGGCCPYATWSADSEWVLFLDGGSDHPTPGLYGIPVSGGRPSLVTPRFGVFSPDRSLVGYLEEGIVYVERWADGMRWTIPSYGQAISFSPDNQMVAWVLGSSSIQSPDRRQARVWVSRSNGDGARELVTIHGGDFIGWVKGSQAILVSGRLSPPGPAGLWLIDTESGAGRLLFEVERPRSLSLSRTGDWLAFFIAFEKDTTRNGVWVLKTDGTFRDHLPLFGSYRWRSDGQIVVMPLDLDDPQPGLYQFDLMESKIYKLVDPQYSPIKMMNNDWSISPDGRWALYHSSDDQNLWVMELPDVPQPP